MLIIIGVQGLLEKQRDVCRNDWNKISQNVTEEFSWKLQWPVYKNNMVAKYYNHSMILGLVILSWIAKGNKLHSWIQDPMPNVFL